MLDGNGEWEEARAQRITDTLDPRSFPWLARSHLCLSISVLLFCVDDDNLPRNKTNKWIISIYRSTWPPLSSPLVHDREMRCHTFAQLQSSLVRIVLHIIVNPGQFIWHIGHIKIRSLSEKIWWMSCYLASHNPEQWWSSCSCFRSTAPSHVYGYNFKSDVGGRLELSDTVRGTVSELDLTNISSSLSLTMTESLFSSVSKSRMTGRWIHSDTVFTDPIPPCLCNQPSVAPPQEWKRLVLFALVRGRCSQELTHRLVFAGNKNGISWPMSKIKTKVVARSWQGHCHTCFTAM